MAYGCLKQMDNGRIYYMNNGWAYIRTMVGQVDNGWADRLMTMVGQMGNDRDIYGWWLDRWIIVGDITNDDGWTDG